MQTPPHILVIIPVYNEAEHIVRTIQSVKKAGYSDILVVNDGSRDGTKELLETLPVVSIHHLINRGQGAAIQTGFDWAKKGPWKILVTMDGDGQCDPTDLKALYMPIVANKADMVVGNRFQSKSNIPLLRQLYNTAGSIITWLLSGVYLQDTQSGMRAYNLKTLENIEIKARGYEFCSDLIRQAATAKLRITDAPVRVFYTKESMKKGQSFAVGLHTVGRLILRSIMR